MQKLIVALTLLSAAMQAQTQTPAFSVDPKKPYVFVSFDRIAPGTPLTNKEEPTRIWLRLRNNSRWPINVGVFEAGHGEDGWALLHGVIEVSNSGTQSDELAKKRAPTGYDSADVVSATVVRPGHQLRFSVPSDHIRPEWYIRVKFEFELPAIASGRQPYSFVDVSWTDLPLDARRQLRADLPAN